MAADIMIQYDTAKLAAQYEAIAASRWPALKILISEASGRLLGLHVDDPDEFWQLAYRRCGLRAAAQSILNRTQDEATLARRLGLLKKLQERPPLTRADLDSQEDKAARTLIQLWVTERDDPALLKASLCFHSDRARAKMVCFLAHAAALSQTGRVPENQAARLPQAEPERIRKLCDKLGLVSAEPRTIKDVSWRSGAIHFEPFQRAMLKP
jgi:hypothetical protein